MTLLSEAPVSVLSAPPQAIGRLALFLDLDGVLAPFAASPEAVQPLERRTRVLKDLRQRLDERVAVVSGRTLDEIDRITDHAALIASGIHGLEYRDQEGRLHRQPADPHVQVVIQALYEFAAEYPGVIVEDKGVSAGLHYRQCPEAEAAALALAQRLAAETGLELQPGSMVLELKTPGSNKGMALAKFMEQPPFLGAVPVMVGDDLTDEYGFEAATRLGGWGVLVGAERPTAATYRLENVDAVLDWLDQVGRVA